VVRKTPNECGQELESYVARLYAGLGYHVQVNVLLNGQQVDLLAVKEEKGAGSIRLVIECKFLSSGSISNQVVHDFRHFIESAKRDAAITKGIIISNSSFTRTARLAAGYHVELMSTHDLEQQLYTFHEQISSIVTEYRHQSIFGSFIPLSGRAEKPIADLTSWAIEIIQSKHSALRLVSILADYGAGKTTLLRRLQYELCCIALAREEAKKPLLFELKHFHKLGDVDLFTQYCLRKQFGIDFPMAVFWAGLEADKFVLLLDGFDEMSSHADRRRKLDNLYALSPLIGGNCISFITCRPAYFVSENEYLETFGLVNAEMAAQQIEKHRSKRSLPQREALQGTYQKLYAKYVAARPLSIHRSQKGEQLTVHLDAFTKEQIALYLFKFENEFKKRCDLTSREILQRLSGIYDLTSLMSTPILLAMIIDTILHKGREFFSETDKLGPAGLYSIYTSLKLDIDWKKGQTRRLLTKEQRRSFAEALALTMYDQQRVEVSYSDITDIIEGLLGSIKKVTDGHSTTVAHVVNDVLTCTFITRGGDDLLRFIHKSYMEFFVACRMKSSLLRERPDPRFRERILPREVLYFLGSYVAQDPEVRAVMLGRLIEIMEADDASKVSKRNVTQERAYRANVMGAYFCGCPQLSGLKIKCGPIVNIDVSGSHLNECYFLDTEFLEVRWMRSKLTKTAFERVRVSQTQFSDCQLSEVRGDMSFNESRMEACEILNSTVRLTGTGSVDRCRVMSSHIVLSGCLRLSEVTMSKTRISLSSGASTQPSAIVIEKSAFDDCVFLGTAARAVDKSRLEPAVLLSTNTFTRCVVVGVIVSMEFLLREAMRASKVQLRGLLVIDDEKLDARQDVEKRNILARLDAKGYLECNSGLFAIRSSSIQNDNAETKNVIEQWLEELKLHELAALVQGMDLT
jgi:Restriction endonuclease